MVLAGCAFQPERWAAGVDIVGISDLVTFLEHTSAYRRAHREREYGSLDDRPGLPRLGLPAAPGRADPGAPVRDPRGERPPGAPLGGPPARRLARGRGVPCELLVYPDEGHGLAKLANRLDAYPRALAFLERALGLDPTGFPAGNADEAELLLDWLGYLRRAVLRKAEGLDEAAAHERPGGALLSLAGIVNHLTRVEWRWIDGSILGEPVERREEELHPGPGADDGRARRRLPGPGGPDRRRRPGTAPLDPLPGGGGAGPALGPLPPLERDGPPRRPRRHDQGAARRDDRRVAGRPPVTGAGRLAGEPGAQLIGE